MALIYLFSCPVLLCHTSVPLGPLDYAAAAFMLLLVAVEFIADGQQWDFQV